MPSSVIRRFFYRADQRELHVEFVTGCFYVYFGVPKDVVREFEVAASKGRYFNTHIRDDYPFRELARDDLDR